MNDRYDQDILLAYLEGELDATQRDQLERALEADPRLRGLLEELSADRQAVRDLPRPPAPEGLLEQALQQHERQVLLGEPDESTAGPGRTPTIWGYRARQWLAYGSLAAGIGIAATAVMMMMDTDLQQTASNWSEAFNSEPTELAEQADIPERDANGSESIADDQPEPESPPAFALQQRSAADDDALSRAATQQFTDQLGTDPLAGDPLAMDDALAGGEMGADGVGGAGWATGWGTGGGAGGGADDDAALTIEVYTDSSAAIEHRVLSWATQNRYRVSSAPVQVDRAIAQAQHISPEHAPRVGQVREVVIATDGRAQAMTELMSALHTAAEHGVAVADRPGPGLASYQPRLDSQQAQLDAGLSELRLGQPRDGQASVGDGGRGGGRGGRGGGGEGRDRRSSDDARAQAGDAAAAGQELAQADAPPADHADQQPAMPDEPSKLAEAEHQPDQDALSDAEADPDPQDRPRAMANMPGRLDVDEAQQPERQADEPPDAQDPARDRIEHSDLASQMRTNPLDWRNRLMPWTAPSGPATDVPTPMHEADEPAADEWSPSQDPIHVRIRIFEQAGR